MCIDELRLKDRSILGALRPGKRHFQTFGFCRVGQLNSFTWTIKVFQSLKLNMPVNATPKVSNSLVHAVFS